MPKFPWLMKFHTRKTEFSLVLLVHVKKKEKKRKKKFGTLAEPGVVGGAVVPTPFAETFVACQS